MYLLQKCYGEILLLKKLKFLFLIFEFYCLQLQNYTVEPTSFPTNSVPQQPVVPATNLSAEVEEALLFSKVTTSILTDYINNKLPPLLLNESETILAETKEGLTYCENALKRNEDIWQYRVCSSAQLRFGIASLSSLKEHYYETNVAKKFVTNFSVIFCVLVFLFCSSWNKS